jgi:hypothetical protein
MQFNPPLPQDATRIAWDPNFFSNVPLHEIGGGLAPVLHHPPHIINWGGISDFFGTNPNIINSNCIMNAINSEQKAINDFKEMNINLKKYFIYFVENRCHLWDIIHHLPESIKLIILNCYTNQNNINNQNEGNQPHFQNKYMKYKMKYLNLKKQF